MRKVRTIFLSDVHLGIRPCQADSLLDFLREYSAQQLFLLGDIVDFQALGRHLYWTTAHNTVVQKILRRARHGERIVLVPGNHDEVLREYVGATFGDIRVEAEWTHTAADGKRYLLIHGDACDPVSGCHRLLAALGDFSYTVLLRVNRYLASARRRIGMRGYWSFSAYVKHRIKRAAAYIGDYESAVVDAARQRGVDGVICGHIHAPTIKTLQGMIYVNCGDWVDNCTAIVEHFDGSMELVRHGLSRPATVTSAHIPELAGATAGDVFGTPP